MESCVTWRSRSAKRHTSSTDPKFTIPSGMFTRRTTSPNVMTRWTWPKTRCLVYLSTAGPLSRLSVFTWTTSCGQALSGLCLHFTPRSKPFSRSGTRKSWARGCSTLTFLGITLEPEASGDLVLHQTSYAYALLDRFTEDLAKNKLVTVPAPHESFIGDERNSTTAPKPPKRVTTTRSLNVDASRCWAPSFGWSRNRVQTWDTRTLVGHRLSKAT